MNKLFNCTVETNGERSARRSDAIRCHINYGTMKSVSQVDINNYESVLNRLVSISVNDVFPDVSGHIEQNDRASMEILSRDILKFKDSFKSFWFEKLDVSVNCGFGRSHADSILVDSIYHKAEMLNLKVKLFEKIESLNLEKKARIDLYDKYDKKVDEVYSDYDKNSDDDREIALERIYNLYPSFLVEISKF